jgi:hypothetical protein
LGGRWEITHNPRREATGLGPVRPVVWSCARHREPGGASIFRLTLEADDTNAGRDLDVVQFLKTDANRDGLLDVVAGATVSGKRRTRTFIT